MDRGQKEAEQRWGLGGRDEWEVESGASGFSVTGGGNEGIFVKQVLKGSSASKIFSLREGDQLLSATIFFDNIKYEDALKILQYSEPYKVQFSLKRKLVGKEDLEKIHSTAQHKKEKINQLKSPGIDVKAPSAEIVVEGPEVKAAGLEGKIKMPKFEKPKFGVTLPKGKVPEGEISLPKMVADVPKPKVKGQVDAIGVETSTFAVEVDVPDVETEASGWKIQMPSLKMPKMPKADIQAPEVDITLPSVDVSLPKGEMDTKGPEATAKGVKIESEIKATDEDAKGKESNVKGVSKMPHFKIPKLSISKFPKSEISNSKLHVDFPEDGGDARAKSVNLPKFWIPDLGFSKVHVSTAKVDQDANLLKDDVTLTKYHMSIQEPKVLSGSAVGDVSIPETDIKFAMTESSTVLKSPEIVAKIPSADIAIDKGEVKLEGFEGKTKMPKFQKMKFGISLPKGKIPESEISLPQMEADIPKPKAIAEVTEIAIEASTLDVKCEVSDAGTEVSGLKMQLPSLKMPQIPKADRAPMVDISLPSVDVTMPTTKVDIQEEQKSQIKKPQFIMPKISFSKIKAPKSQVNLPKVEADITVPKPERDGEDLVQIPDIESSHTKSIEEGAQISIKMPKVQIPTLEFSKPEIKVPKSDMGISLPKVDATFPTYDASLQQADLKSESAGDDVRLSRGIKFPTAEASIELKSPETGIEGPLAVDGAEVKVEGLEGKIKMPKFQTPMFGISLPKGKRPESEISLPKMKAGVPQLTTIDIADIAVEAPILDAKSDVSDAEIEVSTGKMKMPQVSITDIKAPEMGVSLPSVSSGEIQTEEYQGWFKMPKFRMPTFGRSSSKEKRGDIDSEGSLEKPQVSAPSAEMQTEIEAPEYTTSLPHVDTEPAAGKAALEGKIKSAKAEIPKVGVSLHKGKSSDVTSSKFEAEVSLPPEKAVIKVSIPETETYADVVKRGAEGQQLKEHTPKVMIPKVQLSTSEISASKTGVDISLPKADITLPKCDLTLQEQKAKSECAEVPTAEQSIELKSPEIGAKAPSVEIALDGTQKKLDVLLPKVELDILHPGAGVKTEKLGGALGIKMDAEITSKMKTSKFKMPKFGVLHSKAKGSEVDVFLPKLEADIPSSEIKTASFGFSLLKVKIPESHAKVSEDEVHQPKLSDENLGVAIQKTDTSEFKLSGKPQSETDESNDVVSSSVSLPKLKTFTVEVQPSSKLGDTQSDKQPEKIAVSPLSEDDELAKIPEDEEKDMKDQKEKTDSKRSGRFKFWLPSIGFSSSVDDTGLDSKPEVQKSVPEETQPVDSSASDTDSSKQTEKTGWFRFPKLGFSSPSKKAKNIDKEEETNLKEMKTSDDESPSEKPETFFDAEESLSPKEETIKGEEKETTGTSSNVQVSGAIVTSSARTELILMEKERASQQSILEKTTK
uniref:PDZ domain-containing protein n=1 Tax=Chelydra serpentina TaxID=8475 RepID=A0A8C3XQZ7_CHESE